MIYYLNFLNATSVNKHVHSSSGHV